MKFVIFADRSYNYIKPIATGLNRELEESGHQTEIWYDGIYWLMKLNLLKVFVADIYRVFLNFRTGNKKKYIYRFWKLLTFYTRKKKRALRECDCIIVVDNCPSVFYSSDIRRLEYLRTKYGKPIVNYDFHYLPNQAWYKKIASNPNNFGLERFDWYLPVGIVTEYAVPKDIPTIFNCIGMDITDTNLYPEQTEFQVLLDFKRSGYELYRDLVISVLKEENIPYIQLEGRYTTDEIRSIYRKCSAYFVAVRESFGLPIAEIQLCGGYVFTPYAEWCPAYFLNKSPYEKGSGTLGRNFIVYDNDKEKLRSLLKRLRHDYDSKKVIKNFINDYPDYYKINKDELHCFIKELANGQINANSHEEYIAYNKFISQEDDLNL